MKRTNTAEKWPSLASSGSVSTRVSVGISSTSVSVRSSSATPGRASAGCVSMGSTPSSTPSGVTAATSKGRGSGTGALSGVARLCGWLASAGVSGLGGGRLSEPSFPGPWLSWACFGAVSTTIPIWNVCDYKKRDIRAQRKMSSNQPQLLELCRATGWRCLCPRPAAPACRSGSCPPAPGALCAPTQVRRHPLA